MITVYYDGKCNMCAKEINYYRTLDKHNPDGQPKFIWQDINESLADLAHHQITLVDALKRMHAKDSQGKIYVGAEAFILLWQQFPKWRWLARLVNLPIIKQCAQLVYSLWAHYRFKRLAHCQLAVQTKP